MITRWNASSPIAMFALAAGYNKSTYTPESFVKAMEQASKALNEKINIKIIEFSSKKL